MQHFYTFLVNDGQKKRTESERDDGTSNRSQVERSGVTWLNVRVRMYVLVGLCVCECVCVLSAAQAGCITADTLLLANPA